MRAGVVVTSLVFFIMFSMHSNALAARHDGVFAKFRQLPVVQHAIEAYQGIGSDLARKALGLGMLFAATCGTMSCGEVDYSDEYSRESTQQVQEYSVIPLGALTDTSVSTLRVQKVQKYSREDILQAKLRSYSSSLIHKDVYLISDDGRFYLGNVLHGRYYQPGDWFFLVRRADGTEEVVHEDRIGGYILTSSPDIGAPVEIIGDKTDDILTGVIISAYGEKVKKYSLYGDPYYEPVAYMYLVRLDSWGERLVPAGSIVAWLYD